MSFPLLADPEIAMSGRGVHIEWDRFSVRFRCLDCERTVKNGIEHARKRRHTVEATRSETWLIEPLPPG